MNRIPMTEPTARFTSVAACGLSLFATVAAIVLGMRQLQAQAALFLALAFIGCLITVISYRRYAALRKQRWQTELAGTENELNQVLNHTRLNIIMEHVTGPLEATMIDPDQAAPAGEEPPVGEP